MAGHVLKIMLEDTHPPVWRRIIVPERITFEEFLNGMTTTSMTFAFRQKISVLTMARIPGILTIIGKMKRCLSRFFQQTNGYVIPMISEMNGS